MRGKLFRFATMASAVLFVCVGVLWVRSYWRCDSVVWKYGPLRDHAAPTYDLASTNGRIVFTRERYRYGPYMEHAVEFDPGECWWHDPLGEDAPAGRVCALGFEWSDDVDGTRIAPHSYRFVPRYAPLHLRIVAVPWWALAGSHRHSPFAPRGVLARPATGSRGQVRGVRLRPPGVAGAVSGVRDRSCCGLEIRSADLRTCGTGKRRCPASPHQQAAGVLSCPSMLSTYCPPLIALPPLGLVGLFLLVLAIPAVIPYTVTSGLIRRLAAFAGPQKPSRASACGEVLGVEALRLPASVCGPMLADAAAKRDFDTWERLQRVHAVCPRCRAL